MIACFIVVIIDCPDIYPDIGPGICSGIGPGICSGIGPGIAFGRCPGVIRPTFYHNN